MTSSKSKWNRHATQNGTLKEMELISWGDWKYYVYIYAPYYIALNLWVLIPDLVSNNCSYLRHISKGHFKIKNCCRVVIGLQVSLYCSYCCVLVFVVFRLQVIVRSVVNLSTWQWKTQYVMCNGKWKCRVTLNFLYLWCFCVQCIANICL